MTNQSNMRTNEVQSDNYRIWCSKEIYIELSLLQDNTIVYVSKMRVDQVDSQSSNTYEANCMDNKNLLLSAECVQQLVPILYLSFSTILGVCSYYYTLIA